MNHHRRPYRIGNFGRGLLPAVAMTVVLLGPAAATDPVLDQIEAARRAYQDGEARVAIQALQFAVAQIEEQLSNRQLALLPAPLEGWSAEEANSQSGGLVSILTGTNLSRTYRQDSSGATVTINLTADSPLLALMGMMISSPLLMQTEPGTKPYALGGYRGLLRTDAAGAGEIALSLMIGTRILLQIDGSGGATQQMLEAYLKAMDLPAIEKALIG